MPNRRGSPVYQIQCALEGLLAQGEKREIDKGIKLENGLTLADHRIYSRRTLKSYIKSCCPLAKWCRKHFGIKDIRLIMPQHARDYLDERAARGLKGGTLGRDKAAINKLAIALHGKKWDIGESWHSDPRPELYYTKKDALRIGQYLRRNTRDKQTADVIRVQRVTGARVTEATQLRGRDIDLERGEVRLILGTKGGRPRTVQVDRRYLPYLAMLKERAERRRDGHVFYDRRGLAARTGKAVIRACDQLGIERAGTHGFRKAFARRRYRQYRERGLSDRQARKLLARDLGHNRIRITYTYVPRDAEPET